MRLVVIRPEAPDRDWGHCHVIGDQHRDVCDRTLHEVLAGFRRAATTENRKGGD